MAIENLTSNLLINLTLIADLALIALVLVFISKKYGWNGANKFTDYISKNGLYFAFVIALTATFGSLFYSEIMGFEPCVLCWFQRIFMYPLPIILGIALWYKDKAIKKYVIPMSVLGGIVAVYHYLGQVLEKVTTCAPESTVPCTVRYTFGYGYITIPIMALTVFIAIAVLMFIWKEN